MSFGTVGQKSRQICALHAYCGRPIIYVRSEISRMTRNSKKPTPPEGLPEQLVSVLGQLNTDELRNTIVHVQELLQFHEETVHPIEPSPKEDVIRITEHEGYTEVVKRVPCGEDCSDCPHGPYLYHVTQERHPESEEKPHWIFIGGVNPDDE